MLPSAIRPVLCLLVAAGCSAEGAPTPGPAGGAAGRGVADAGRGNGGSSGGHAGNGAVSGGTAGTTGGGAMASAGSAGVAASGGAGQGTAGDGGAGAAGTGGLAGSGAAAGSGTDGGAGGLAGAGGATGGVSGATGGTDGGSDRCDLAVHDPAKPPAMLTLSGSLGTHDPVMIEAGGRFYLYNTGNRVGAKTSTDMLSWQNAPAVFTANPAWIAQSVPGATNLWAPDISHFGGMYHLYYSASTFGKNRSCIGHATRAALDTGSFADQGSVVCSNVTSSGDNWNAIDPNVVVDQDGKAWLSFGSFWGGIKMIELDQEGKRVGTTLHALAARPQNRGALEAPFIVRRCGYYYLFVSFDTCCEGVNSTYNVRVGRSASVTGPYVDKAGTAMMEGGGTLLLEGGTRFKGPGHNAVVFSDTKAYNLYHSYDANANGQSVLRIAELVWDTEGWPISAGP